MDESDRERSQILSAAGVVLTKRGLGSNTLSVVASQAGVDFATVVVHFPDVRALVLAVMREECGRYEAEMGWPADCHAQTAEAITIYCLRSARVLIDSAERG